MFNINLHKGLTLIETVITLSFLGMAIIGVISYYHSVDDNNKLKEMKIELMSIIANVVPESFKKQNGELHNPFGGVIAIENDGHFLKILTKIPLSLCIDLTTMNLGRAFYSLSVGHGKTLYQILNPNQAAKYCQNVVKTADSQGYVSFSLVLVQ